MFPCPVHWAILDTTGVVNAEKGRSSQCGERKACWINPQLTKCCVPICFCSSVNAVKCAGKYFQTSNPQRVWVETCWPHLWFERAGDRSFRTCVLLLCFCEARESTFSHFFFLLNHLWLFFLSHAGSKRGEGWPRTSGEILWILFFLINLCEM